jgi:hypothetical protein
MTCPQFPSVAPFVSGVFIVFGIFILVVGLLGGKGSSGV